MNPRSLLLLVQAVGCSLIFLPSVWNAQALGGDLQSTLYRRPPALQPGAVPREVRYHFADHDTVAQQAEWLKNALQPSSADTLFGGIVMVGPGAWHDLKATGRFGKQNSVPMGVHVPGPRPLNVEGRVLRDPGEREQLQKHLRDLLARDGGFKIRAMTSAEMSLWWTFISFDVQEPVFVVVSRSHRFVFNLQNPGLAQMDDLDRLQATLAGNRR